MAEDMADSALEFALARAILLTLDLVQKRWDPRWRSTFGGFASQLDSRLWEPELARGTELFRLWEMADDFVDEELEPAPNLDRARHERTRVELIEWANRVLANTKVPANDDDAS